MKQKLTLYYDQQCPFCNKYAAFLSLKEHYDLEIRNAREYYSEVEGLCKETDINEGLIIVVDEKCLQGIDALRYLDSAMEKRGIFSKLHGIWHLKGPVSGALYRSVKLLRKMVLFLMGRKSRIE